MAGKLKKRDPIPSKDHVTRYCNSEEVQNGQILASAFELRLEKKEKYLSVNWLEYFEGLPPEVAIVKIRKALKDKKLCNKDGLIAAINVGELLKVDLTSTIEVLYLGSKKDKSYSGIFGQEEINELAALEMLDLVTEKMTFRVI